MKIAFLMPFLQLYGAIRTMVDLSNELVDRHHSVALYHSDGSKCEWLKVKAEIRSKAAIMEGNYDIVIANLRGVVGLLHSCKSTLKFYFISDKWSEFDASYQSMLNSDWAKLAPTKVCQEWLIKKGVASYYLPPGVDEEIFYPVKCESIVANSVFCLLWSGDRRPGKGQRVVKEMSEILKRKGVDFKLSTYYDKGVNQEDMAKVYSQADIFIESVSGDSALRSNPVLEAMSCGTTVLCSAHESIQEWAVHGETAYIVARDPDLLANAVITLKNDPVLMQRLREGALKKVSEFTWKRAGDLFEQIIEIEMKRCEVV